MIYGIIARRLRWYAQATAQLLRRRWQALLLFLGLFGASLLAESSYLVLALLDDDHGFVSRLIIIVLWQCCWIVWALMQYDQLRGGQFRNFTQSLPISSRQSRITDLAVLLISDTPLFLPFVTAAFALGAHQGQALHTLNGGLIIVFLLSTQLASQLAVLDKSRRDFSSILLINVWVAIALGQGHPTASFMLGLAVLGGLWCLMVSVPALLPNAVVYKFGRMQHVWPQLSRKLLSKLSSLPRLSLGILSLQHSTSLLSKLLSCLLLVLLAVGLMSIWRYDGRSLPMALLAAGLIALTINGLYRHLLMAHSEARSFTASLPLPPRWSLSSDSIVVLGFGTPFVLVMAVTLWRQTELSALRSAGFLAGFVLLVLLLRVLLHYFKNHFVLSASLTTGLWIFAMVLCLQS